MPYSIGIDVGATYIKYGLVGRDGRILYESIRNTRHPGVSLMDAICETIREIRQKAGGRSIRGIGLGVPGMVDGHRVIGCAGNLPEMEGVSPGPILAESFRTKIMVENDANLMGLAEARWGAARNAQDVVFLTIGTGIGGALILDGRLCTGYRNRGTELGHIHVAGGNRLCTCGAVGCLEAQASVQALVEDYKGLLPHAGDAVDGKLIVSRYLEGQPAAMTAMNRHFNYLASGIASLVNIFAPQKLIIGGGISEAGDFYVDRIREKAMALAMKETSEFTTIEPATLGNKAGFLGAAALVFEDPAFKKG
ncbi:MAG TPA: ROK family protein [Puia sp.]|nr:ROK family protein [Puia sp.]